MRRGYADTRLGQMHYTTWGKAPDPAVVLLPQSANSAAMFADLASDLQADFHVVAIEYPGSGWSDPMPGELSFGDIAASFIDVLDQLGLGRCTLYGHHTGNKIAAAMAAAYPDRVNNLIFVGQSHSIVASNAQRSGTVGKLRRKLLESEDNREAALVQWADLFSRINAKWWNEKVVRDIGNDTRRAFVARKVADELLSAMSMPPLYRANFAHDLEHDLRNVQAPTLIIEIATASEDAAIGRQGQHLQRIMKRATVAVLEEPDGPANTMEHRAADLARLVREYLKAGPGETTFR
jgi:pimeloyl-ACP methyl ester carboxylesterase